MKSSEKKSLSAKIESSQFFPLIDLLRVEILQEGVSIAAIGALLKRVIECYQNSNQNTLCTVRCCANYLARLSGETAVDMDVVQFVHGILGKASADGGATKNSNLLMASYTCFLNYTVYEGKRPRSEGMDELVYDMLSNAVSFIAGLSPTDIFNTKLAPVIVRALAGLGTWAANNKNGEQIDLVRALVVSNEDFGKVALKLNSGENVHFKQLSGELMELMEMLGG